MKTHFVSNYALTIVVCLIAFSSCTHLSYSQNIIQMPPEEQVFDAKYTVGFSCRGIYNFHSRFNGIGAFSPHENFWFNPELQVEKIINNKISLYLSVGFYKIKFDDDNLEDKYHEVAHHFSQQSGQSFHTNLGISYSLSTDKKGIPVATVYTKAGYLNQKLPEISEQFISSTDYFQKNIQYAFERGHGVNLQVGLDLYSYYSKAFHIKVGGYCTYNQSRQSLNITSSDSSKETGHMTSSFIGLGAHISIFSHFINKG
ncbi:MAG: hypothetical protein MI974_07595 [Chitinophagales bacterium]|nr:hypothetical protein [Chitinophagales bacterium]